MTRSHLAFIRSLPCAICGCSPSEAAHIRIGSGAGIARKPADSRTVPLCTHHHRQQHERGERTFWGDVDRAIELAERLHRYTNHGGKARDLIYQWRNA